MAASDIPNLTRDDAHARAELLRVESYEIALDLTDGGGKPSDRTFRSTSTIRFTTSRPGESTLRRRHRRPLPLRHAQRGGRGRVGLPQRGRASRCPTSPTDNVLVVDADLLYTNTGEGLHRFVDPLDGEVYLYSQFETADAKRMYACFDQPDLKATFSIRVTVPDHWLACVQRRTGRRGATARRQDHRVRDHASG